MVFQPLEDSKLIAAEQATYSEGMDEQGVIPEELGNNRYFRTLLDVATCRICGAVMWKNEEGFIESHLKCHGIHYKKRYLFE